MRTYQLPDYANRAIMELETWGDTKNVNGGSSLLHMHLDGVAPAWLVLIDLSVEDVWLFDSAAELEDYVLSTVAWMEDDNDDGDDEEADDDSDGPRVTAAEALENLGRHAQRRDVIKATHGRHYYIVSHDSVPDDVRRRVMRCTDSGGGRKGGTWLLVEQCLALGDWSPFNAADDSDGRGGHKLVTFEIGEHGRVVSSATEGCDEDTDASACDALVEQLRTATHNERVAHRVLIQRDSFGEERETVSVVVAASARRLDEALAEVERRRSLRVMA